MEVYNADEPSGTASVAGELTAPENVSVIAGTTTTIRFEHTGGNQGVFVNQIALSGDNAADFAITSSLSNTFLIPIDATSDVLVEYNGMINGATASLDMTFSGNQVISVALTGTQVPEPNSPLSLGVGLVFLCLFHRRKILRRTDGWCGKRRGL